MLTLTELSEVPTGTLDPSALLGVMAMYHMPDRTADADKVRRAWKMEALPEDKIPGDVQPVNVFKRAVTSVKTRRGATGNVEITADMVTDTAQRCTYQVTRLDRDLVQQVINHKRTLIAVFDKNTDVISFAADQQNQEIAELQRSITDYFNANIDTMPSATIRAMVRDTLLDIGAVNLRRRAGGVYFVPIDQQGVVASLGVVLNQAYGMDAAMQQYPVLNNKAAKDMVAEHHEFNVQAELDGLIETAKERVAKGGTMRKEFLNNLITERRSVNKRLVKYKQLLGVEADKADTKLELLDEALQDLLGLRK